MKFRTDESILLSVRNLCIESVGRDMLRHPIVHGVTFDIPRGKVTAIVGESGSGKTLTANAIIGLLKHDELRICEGSSIKFDGVELTSCNAENLHAMRGVKMAMIFQEPGSCLNPVLSIGEQLAFPLRQHKGLSRTEALTRAEGLLADVGIDSPRQRMKAFPHELSGGQQQRVMIAMALACEPELLIADEPTSALDVTVQRQILDLLAELQVKYGMTLLLITHDLAVVGEVADRVIVFQNGVVREQGTKAQVLEAPSNQYTQALIASRSRMLRPSTASEIDLGESHPGKPHSQQPNVPQLLMVKHLSKKYEVRKNLFKSGEFSALKDVSFDLIEGETLGVVGESGSGKTTVAKILARLIDPNNGVILVGSENILSMNRRQFRPYRRQIQMVFQNPYGSLNPRWTIRQTLLSPMNVHGLGADERGRVEEAGRLLESVGLSGQDLDRYPHQFSGGQRQRIAIARALAVQPSIIICDEVVSALDVTVQVQVMDLLKKLQQDRGITYIFISHDLASIRYMADRVLVMRNGEIVEQGGVKSVFSAPVHPYTSSLLDAQPHFKSIL